MQRRKANLKSKSFSLITFCSGEISFLVLQVSVRANGREGRRAIGSQPKSTSLPGLLRSKPNSSAATIIPWSRFLEPYSCWYILSLSQWDIRYLMHVIAIQNLFLPIAMHVSLKVFRVLGMACPPLFYIMAAEKEKIKPLFKALFTRSGPSDTISWNTYKQEKKSEPNATREWPATIDLLEVFKTILIPCKEGYRSWVGGLVTRGLKA